MILENDFFEKRNPKLYNKIQQKEFEIGHLVNAYDMGRSSSAQDASKSDERNPGYEIKRGLGLGFFDESK
jgi:hypothetical protein